jgi:ubiquinone/menaquinone biosynthesis C-methylase UbiE
MKQATFASAAWDRKRKMTRRERFLAKMDAVIRWSTILTFSRARRLPSLNSSSRLAYNISTDGRILDYLTHLQSAAPSSVAIPAYLSETYWWAYVHPWAVRFFERQWLVNLILWGNVARLRDAALDELGPIISGRTLQVACVYGDFSTRLASRIAPSGWLDIVDVLPVQLRNLRQKLAPSAPFTLYQRDSAALGFESASYDQAFIFFLLHEQPTAIRRQTLREALRVVKPGGKVVIVDYRMPQRLHPLRYLFPPILRALEPYALDFWHHDIAEWLPEHVKPTQIRRQPFYGGLYQKVVVTA